MPYEHSAMAASAINSMEVFGMSNARIASKSNSMVLLQACNS